ncbi:MAG: MFS transporter [Promethearchaeota archaeon]
MQLRDKGFRYTEDFNSMVQIVIWNSLGFFFLGFLIPIIARLNMGATGLEIGLIVSIQVLGRMLSSFITGFLIDRFKSKIIFVLIGSFGRGASYFFIFGAIIMNSLIGLCIGTFILGFMAGIFWVPFDTLVAEKSNKNHRSHAYGKRDSANAKGQIIGSLLGFTILTTATFFTSNPFILYFAIPLYGLANFYAGVKYIHDVDDTIKFSDITIPLNDIQSNEGQNSKEAYSFTMLLGLFFLLIAVLLSSINGSLAKPFLNIYLLENIESDLFLVTMAYLPAGIFATLLAPKLGALVDKSHPLVGITITSIFGAIITWFLINTDNIWIFAILLLIDMTIVIAAGLIFRNLLSRITVEHRGKIIGTSSFFTYLGSVIGPILGGFTWDYLGQKFPFIISIFIELSLIPFYIVVVYFLLPNLTETFEVKKKKD